MLEVGRLGYSWGPAHKGKLGALRGAPANKGKLGALRAAPAKKRKERPVSGTMFHRLRNGRTPRLGETALLRNGRTPSFVVMRTPEFRTLQ